MKVENGKEVHIEYTGTLKDGTTFDTNVGKEALVFVPGEGKVIKGFEDNVVGMAKDEEKEFTIESKDAYGEPNEQLIQDVPKAAVPATLEIKEGAMLMLQAPTGQQIPARVVAIEEESIKLDMNHPLAGKDLTFKIKILDVKDAPAAPAEEPKEEEKAPETPVETSKEEEKAPVEEKKEE